MLKSVRWARMGVGCGDKVNEIREEPCKDQ